MKGKYRFTKAEEQHIRQILKELEKNRNRETRQKLRDIGFFISDFTRSNKGFTELDFNALIESKRIQIIN